MSKLKYNNNCYVAAKKWDGTQFLGLYEYTYTDGSFCVLDVKNGKRFNVKPKDMKFANEEETNQIKNIIKEYNINTNATTTETNKQNENELELITCAL